MRYTITIPDAADEKLRERARNSGEPAEAVLQQLVEQALDRPALRDILAPVHEEFLRSGMRAEELDQVLIDAMAESRRERVGRREA